MDAHAWITAIAVGLASLLTLILTKGIDAYERWRSVARADELAERECYEAEADKIEKGMQYIIGKQDSRITHLEAELEEVRDKHSNCEQRLAGVMARLDFLEKAQGDK